MPARKMTRPQPNVFLRQVREAKGWTQQEVAELIGAPHPFMVNRWENGVVFPSPVYRKKLAALFGKTVAELGLLPPPSKQAERVHESSHTLPPWHVPPLRNPFFTGREETLERIHEFLCGEQARGLPRACAIHGLGGVGKTQVAVEYAYRFRQCYTAVFWIDAATSETLTASMLDIAHHLHLPEREVANHQRVVAAVQRWLSTHQEWLLIWDNLEERERFQRFLSSTYQGAILLTTRNPVLGGLALPLEVSPMAPEVGKWLLLRRARVSQGRVQATQNAGQPSAQAMAAERLAILLGGLPLALDQAGAYIEETGCSLTDYLQRYEQQRAHLLDRRGQPSGGHPHSVTTTFRMLWQRLVQDQPRAADLLRMCTLLHAEAIPEELFVGNGSHRSTHQALDAYQFDLAVAALRALSLVQRSPDTHTLSLHRLVQAVLREEMSTHEHATWQQRVIHLLNAAFPAIASHTGTELWEPCERLLPHAMSLSATVLDHCQDQELADLLLKAADYLDQRSQYGQAQSLYQQALQIQIQVVGLEHPTVAALQSKLAYLYRLLGNYAQAESLFQSAVRVLKQALGETHPEVAYPLEGLAMVYYEQGKYTLAEPLQQRALHIREQARGEAHPEVALSLMRLGNVYYERGKYELAEVAYQQALQIREQTGGPEHSRVAGPLNNLGNLYRAQGKYELAESFCQRAVHLAEQTLGLDHPDLAVMLGSLADLYREWGNSTQAKVLYQRALAIVEQALGPDHHAVAYPLHGMALLCIEQDQDEQAKTLFQRALQIREQRLGRNHPTTVSTRNDYTRLLEQRKEV